MLLRRYPPSSLLRDHARIPMPRLHFVLRTYRRRPLPLTPSTTGHRDRPALVCPSFLECALYTGGSAGALDQFFPVDFGLRHTTVARLFRKGSHKTVPRGPIFSIRQAFLYVAALQFVCPLTVRHHQLAPEDVQHPSLLSLRCLRHSRVCYPADWSIAGAGLSPARKTAAVGCTVVR